MYRALKFSAIVISMVVLFSACNKDDDNGPSNPSPSKPTGELSVQIGSETFTATSVTARETSNGTFMITANDNNAGVLKFTIASFIGNAIYPLGPGLGNEATYSYVVNGTPVSFSTDAGAGSLTITGYDSNKQTFDGTFTFEATQVGGSSLLSFEDGKLKDVPILTLEDAEPGKATVFLNGAYHDIDSAYAQFNNNFSIEIFLFPEGYAAPIRIIGLGYINGTSSTITFGKPFNKSLSEMQYMRASQDYGEISMEGNMEIVSGHIAMNSIDFELNYNEIPIIKYPMEVESGELLMKYDGNTVVFTQAESENDYYYAPTTITVNFKATNTTADSLSFSYSYPGEYTPNYWTVAAHETGVHGSLKYYSNGTLVKSEIGYYGRNNENYGFDPKSSAPDAMRMRGIDVP